MLRKSRTRQRSDFRKETDAICTLIRECLIGGENLYDIWDATWGEASQIVSAQAEREQRRLKSESVIAYCQAKCISIFLFGSEEDRDLGVEEIFPFWTEEESNEMKVARLKSRMMRIAKK